MTECRFIGSSKEDKSSNVSSGFHLRQKIGGKGASLWQLQEWGLPVPSFCCITSDAFEEALDRNELSVVKDWLSSPNTDIPLSQEEISRAIMSLTIPENVIDGVDTFLNENPESYFAVRSSGTLEDDFDASFAGLYKTILNVKKREDVINAVKECWSALFDEQVRAYVKEKVITKSMGLGLVLQILIPSEKSGVLFTVDPVGGRDKEMLVEACFGLGEALVSGQVNPDQYKYDWYNNVEVSRSIAEKKIQCKRIDNFPFVEFETLSEEVANKEVLTIEEVKVLVELSLKIQVASKYPVDIEWAKYKSEFFILQSRPITKIGYAGIPGEWTTADLRDGGVSSTVCTPYMASLYKSVMDVTMTDYIRRLGFKPKGEDDVWQENYYCRPYWNLLAVKTYLSTIPGFKERVFDQGLGINPNYDGDGLTSTTSLATLIAGLRALMAIKSSARSKLVESPDFANKQKARLEELALLDFSLMTDDELFIFYKNFINKEYFRSESTYFDFIYENTNVNSFFKEKIERLPFDINEYPVLLSGLTSVSHMAQIEAMWKMRDEIQACPIAETYWLESSVEEINDAYIGSKIDNQFGDLTAYLKHFGHHSKQELDLTVPRYREDLPYVIGQIKDVLDQPTASDPRIKNLQQQERALIAKKKLLSCASMWRKKGISNALDQVREFLWWREELRDLSTQFYYYVRKVTLEVEKRLVENGILNNVSDIFFLDKNRVIDLINNKESKNEMHQVITKNKYYYESFSKFEIPDEIGEKYSNAGMGMVNPYGQSESVGVAGSPGVTTGIARVVENINDAHRLQANDILITRCTDPGWTPKFSLLRGVVTETGGILSHAAVICREYGIPAILAVKKATALIEDGEIITIDGNSGQIFVGEGEDAITLASRYPSASSGNVGLL